MFNFTRIVLAPRVDSRSPGYVPSLDRGADRVSWAILSGLGTRRCGIVPRQALRARGMRDWVRTRLTVGVADQHGEFVHDLREVLRVAPGRNALPSAAIVESRTLPSTPASGTRAGYDGAKRRRGSQVHMAVDTLGHLLAWPVTTANAQDRSHVHTLAGKCQK